MPSMDTTDMPPPPSSTPTPTGQEGAPPTANPHAMDATEREVLMLMPMPSMDTTVMLHMLTVLPHTDTDMVSELPDTQLVPPSLPDPHRDLARDLLMPSTDTESSQSQPQPADMDLPDTESPRDTPDMPALSSKSQDCTKPIIYFFKIKLLSPC